MTNEIFLQLSVVLVIAAAISYAMKLLKQPLIVGYILTGILVGPGVFGLVSENRAFDAFSQIGVALLLFIIGLELSITVIKRLGKVVFLTAAAILMTVGTIGYLICLAFQLAHLEAVLIGLALFFSSTIIIAKFLSDKKEITRLNGQIAIGVILLDDMIATFALLFVAASKNDALDGFDIIFLVIKGAIFIVSLIFLSYRVLPRITKSIAKSQELLFLFALSWGFGVASIVNLIGFSIEVGALFAGVALAQLPYVHEIGARLKPLRDFFVILFFISLGEHLQLTSLGSVIAPAIVLSLVVMLLKPIVVMLTLGLFGYTRRTSFKTGINLSQVSEFSIILIVLASSSGLISEKIVAIITLVALITITISAYLMQYDNEIYKRIQKHLEFFEKSNAQDTNRVQKSNYPLVLVGYSNGGHQYLRTFRSLRKKFVVIDYDPEVIDDLQRANINYLYGDVTDPELLAEINIDAVRLVVNTIGDHEVNRAMAQYIRRRNDKAVIVCYSSNYTEASELYAIGVSYVMLPHFIGSERLSSFIATHGVSRSAFNNYREKHMIKIGHTAIRHNDL